MAVNCPIGLIVAILMFGAICKKTVVCEETSWFQMMLRPLGLHDSLDTTHHDPSSSLVPQPSSHDPQQLTLLWGIPDTEAKIGTLFMLTIPVNAFQGKVQRYQVQMAGDRVLPSWLYFNESDQSFLGIPSPLDLGPCAIEVTAIQQDIRVTTHFIIKVTSRTDHLAWWSFSYHSANPIQMLQNEPWDSKPLCNWNQNVIRATLVLDITYSDLTAKQRVNIVQVMSDFLTRSTHMIELVPKRHETITKLLNKEMLAAGPGNIQGRPSSEGTEMSWIVGCQTSTKVNDLANVLEHNVQGSRLTAELQHNVIGWHISGVQPPPALRTLSRKRRAVAINQTPLATPSLSLIPPSQMIAPTSTVDYDVIATHMKSQLPGTSSIYDTDSDFSTLNVEEGTSAPLNSVVTPSLPMFTYSLISNTEDSKLDVTEVVTPSSDIIDSSKDIMQTVVISAVDFYSDTHREIVSSEPIYSHLFESSQYDITSNNSEVLSQSTSSELLSKVDILSILSIPSVFSYTITPSLPEVPFYESGAVSPSQSVRETSGSQIIEMDSNAVLSTSTPQLQSATTKWQEAQPSSQLEGKFSVISDATISPSDLVTSVPLSSSFDADLRFNSPHLSAMNVETISISMDVSQSMLEVFTTSNTEIDKSAISRSSVYDLVFQHSSLSVLSTTNSTLANDNDLTYPSADLDKSSQQIHITATVQVHESNSISYSSSVNRSVDAEVVTSLMDFSTSSIQTTATTATPALPTSSAIWTSLNSEIESLVHTLPPTIAGPEPSKTVTPTSNSTHDVEESFQPYSDSVISQTLSGQSSQLISPSDDITPSLTNDSSPSIYDTVGTTQYSANSTEAPVRDSVTTTDHELILTSSYPFRSSVLFAETTTATENFGDDVNLHPSSYLSLTESYDVSMVSQSYSDWTSREWGEAHVPLLTDFLSNSHPQHESATDRAIEASTFIFELSASSVIDVIGTETDTTMATMSEHEGLVSSVSSEIPTTWPASLFPVTEKTTFSTTKTPRLPTRSTEPAQGPVLIKPLGQIQVEAGRYFEYQIPRDTFYSSRDGSTDKLKLSLLEYDAKYLSSNSWLVFDEQKQIIHGLPMSDQANDTHAFLLTATDSLNRRAVSLVAVNVRSSDVKEPSHRFNVTIDYDYAEFKSSIKNLFDLVKVMSSYYGDSTPDNLTVLDVTQGSVILSWTNNSLSHTVCESEVQNSLYNKLYKDGITESFRKHLHPFRPLKVTVEYMGVCSVKIAQSSSNTKMLLVSILVPLFILFLGLFLLVCFCGFCRSRRKQQGQMDLDGDAPTFAANRKPVLMEGELELNEMKAASAIEMTRDFNDFFEPSFYPESPIKKPPPYGIQGVYNFAFESDDISSNRSSPPEYKSQRSSPNMSPPLYRLPPPYPKFV